MCRLSLGHCNWCMFCRQEPHTFQYLHDATAMSEAMQCHLNQRKEQHLYVYNLFSFPPMWCRNRQTSWQHARFFAKIPFFLWLLFRPTAGKNSGASTAAAHQSDGPPVVSSLTRRALLVKQCCLSGRISSAWWSPTVRPEHWERGRGEGERRERGIWGARLLSLWGVIPEINVEICVNPACQLCHPTFLARPRESLCRASVRWGREI